MVSIRSHLFLIVFLGISAVAGAKAPDLGIKVGRFDTGKLDAITDVKGVKVGHVTLIEGEGKLKVGGGPVRTGVTVILPVSDNVWNEKPMAGSFVLNGNGEAMGLMWVQESGFVETPIALTNTLNVANVQKGLIEWMTKTNPRIGVTDDPPIPVVFECDDSVLNDIRGQHVKSSHVLKAIERATAGPVAEGNQGAGTGMIAYGFKGGIGTASRVVKIQGSAYTVGVLVNANHGRRPTFRVLGVPVGAEIPEGETKVPRDGSIIVVIATDAPLESRQLSRLAKRSMLGIARTGAISTHSSGDVAIAFTTTNRVPHYPKKALFKVSVLSDFWVDPLFEATADGAEEALLNAMLAAEDMKGRDGKDVLALPKERLKTILKKYTVPK